MNRRVVGALLAPCVLVLGGFGGPAVAKKKPKKPKIVGMSHTHPGTDTSFVCARVRGLVGRGLVVEVDGPGVLDGPDTVKVGNLKRVTFEIYSAGPYTFIVENRAGKVLATRTYTVPAPPPPGQVDEGPFSCLN